MTGEGCQRPASPGFVDIQKHDHSVLSPSGNCFTEPLLKLCFLDGPELVCVNIGRYVCQPGESISSASSGGWSAGRGLQ